MFKKAIVFLTEDVWRLRLDELPKGKSIGLKALRVVLHAIKGFNENRSSLGASALTFFTMLSIVPLFAMAFGVAQGFGLEKMLETQIKSQIQGQDEVIAYIIEFSNKMLNNTSGGLIAGIGVVILFFTVIRLLGNIELYLNGIWGVVEHRSWVRKFSDYLAIMVVCPVLMIVASSMNVFIIGQLSQVAEEVELVGVMEPFIKFALKLSPFIVLWLLFSFIYTVIPNTRVKILSGFIGGVAGGTIFQIFQLIYINVMAGMLSNSAVYGGFAALPLFLLWLQISWQILLFGAEVSFAYQNVETYGYEPDSLNASDRFRKLSALRIVNVVVKAFVDGKGPVSELEINEGLEIPTRLLKELLHKLEEANILIEVKGDGESRMRFFAPAKDSESLTIGSVLNALELRGKSDIPILDCPEIPKLREALEQFHSGNSYDTLQIPLKSI